MELHHHPQASSAPLPHMARPAHLTNLGLGYGWEKECSFLINDKCNEAIAPTHLVRDGFSLACARVDLSNALPLHGGGPQEQQHGVVVVPLSLS